MKPLKIANKLFEWGQRTYIMGILNITPDSFSGDGLYSKDSFIDDALKCAEKFAEQGADILDVGGESTRPGAEVVSAAEELERVIPIIEALADQSELIISIDSYKAQVVDAALSAGAHMVNDVWGLKADPEMGALVAQHKVPIVLMHNRSRPNNEEVRERLGGRYVGVAYEDLLADIKRELQESISLAHDAGIVDENIILDPGIGFGKTVEQNLALLNRTNEIRDLGFPTLIGSSRKSFIGYTLDVAPDQRLEGTAATVAIAIARGADLIRVHDVETMVRVARMTDAITRN